MKANLGHRPTLSGVPMLVGPQLSIHSRTSGRTSPDHSEQPGIVITAGSHKLRRLSTSSHSVFVALTRDNGCSPCCHGSGGLSEQFQGCVPPPVRPSALMNPASIAVTSHLGVHASKETGLASNKMEMSGLQRAKQRTVLGVLTENEQHSRLLQGGQHAKCSSYPDAPQSAVLSRRPGCDVSAGETLDVAVPASADDMDASDSSLLDVENLAALQHRDFRLFLDLSTNSCADTSMQSLPEEPFVLDNELDLKVRPRPNYMRNHPDITGCMREVLVDWLAEVAEEYKLCAETLHLAASYLDRFLSYTTSVTRAKLQLVGTVALLLAAKYEEVYPPEMEDFVYITDGTYDQKQLVRMEQMFLKVLAFNMTVPTAHQFLRLFITIQPVCSKTAYLALYVAELSVMEMETAVTFPPSVVAASAYCLANYTLSRDLWPDSLKAFTGYSMVDIVPCLKDLHRIYFSAEARPQQAIREKYKSSKYASVSLMTPPTTLPFP
ncbi:Cyclin-A1 [Merluccius polli]|uniref:G2/mitotic-specific cyclin-B2 n=1 Tax=Merluccius polli TaxID=89951 RepID=A0AA47NU19_MERPO|nr:Cyclin-A1 [Merluccius polli]